MTTIAVKSNVMACDSRITGGPIMTAKSKVVKGRDCLVGYCGDGIPAYNAALYVAKEIQELPEIQKEDDFWLLVLRKDGISFVDKYFREMPIRDKFAALGSGEMAAMTAMAMGATAAEAVKMAIRFDEGSGGKVLEYTLD